MTDLVRSDTAGGVATLTLDSPANRNALSRTLREQLLARLAEATARDDVHVVVLRAEGPAFCSGADLREAAEEGMERGARDLVALQRAVVAAPVPVVVRLHGAVRAGGLGLVGAADVVVAADTVTFAFTEVRLALAPAAISLTCLPRLEGRAGARTWLTGETFDAEEARRCGLVTTVVGPDELDDAVAAVVAPMREAPRQGLLETKTLLNADVVSRIDTLGEEAARTSARLFATDEARAAMRAAVRRR